MHAQACISGDAVDHDIIENIAWLNLASCLHGESSFSALYVDEFVDIAWREVESTHTGHHRGPRDIAISQYGCWAEGEIPVFQCGVLKDLAVCLTESGRDEPAREGPAFIGVFPAKLEVNRITRSQTADILHSHPRGFNIKNQHNILRVDLGLLPSDL